MFKTTVTFEVKVFLSDKGKMQYSPVDIIRQLANKKHFFVDISSFPQKIETKCYECGKPIVLRKKRNQYIPTEKGAIIYQGKPICSSCHKNYYENIANFPEEEEEE